MFVSLLRFHNLLKQFLGFAKTARGRMQVLCDGLGGLQVGLFHQVAQLLWHLAFVRKCSGNSSQQLAVDIAGARRGSCCFHTGRSLLHPRCEEWRGLVNCKGRWSTQSSWSIQRLSWTFVISFAFPRCFAVRVAATLLSAGSFAFLLPTTILSSPGRFASRSLPLSSCGSWCGIPIPVHVRNMGS